MRYLNSRRPQAVLLTALALLSAIVACSLPGSPQKGKDLSQEEALQLVLDEIVQPDQLGDDPTIVFVWPEVLLPDDELHPYIFGEDPTTAMIAVESDSWFFWIEDTPYAHFAHPSRFVLVDIESGKLSSSDQDWWPVLNGEGLWTDTGEYQNEDNWAWSNVSFKESGGSSRKDSSSVLAAIAQPQIGLSQTEPGSRKALVINAFSHKQTHTETGESDATNMIRVLGKTDFKITYLGTDHADRSNGVSTPFTPRGTKGVDPWQTELQKQAGEMKPGDTLVVYVGGHGVGEGERYIKNENGNIASYELRDELKEFDPGVDVIVILQGCYTGSWIKDLEGVANLTITATDADYQSYGDFDTRFWLFGTLFTNIDLNPFDEGSEYTSSLVASWEEILGDPDLLDEIEQRTKDEGISFLQALISEAHKEGYWLDLAARLKLSYPQISFGSSKDRQKTSENPTSTPTPEPSPTPSSGAVLGDYQVSMAVKRDPSGHKGFINMPGNIKLTLKEGSIKIEGPFPFVAVSGELSEDGTIDASGRGTVAGYGNIKVTFQGGISDGSLEGDYTMGANGGLPGGQSIVYCVTGDHLEPTATPTPDPRIGELQEFFYVYNARFQAVDVDGLLALLHPAVLDLYGQDACQDYLSSVIDNTIQIEVLQLQALEPWTWEIDGHSTLIEDAYSIQAGVTAGGQTIQQSMHLGLVEDGSINWFTDCGEPLP